MGGARDPAMITNALLERMHETAAFSDDENVKLQEFADLCTDIESQVAYLPGLAGLNFPTAIQPIVEKLPPPLYTEDGKRRLQSIMKKTQERTPDL